MLTDLTPAKFAKLLRGMGKVDTPMGLLKDPNGELKDTPEDTVELVVSTFFPGNVPDHQDFPRCQDRFHDHRRQNEAGLKVKDCVWTEEATHDQLANEIFAENKVTQAIMSFNSFKAPGMDGIQFGAIKTLYKCEKVRERLILLFKISFIMGFVPKCLRTSEVVFIGKPARKDYDQIKSFRPISLSPCLFRLQERLIMWHVEQTTFKTEPFHEKQHAFRRGKSTETALSYVVNYIESKIYQGQLCLAVSGFFSI